MRRRKRRAKARRRSSTGVKAPLLTTLSTRSPPADTRLLWAPQRIPAPPPTWATAFMATASTWRACRSRSACECGIGSLRVFVLSVRWEWPDVLLNEFHVFLTPQMYEGLQRWALRDPKSGGQEPVWWGQPHRVGADGVGDHRRRPVGHQLHRYPAHDLCSVSAFCSLGGWTVHAFRESEWQCSSTCINSLWLMTMVRWSVVQDSWVFHLKTRLFQHAPGRNTLSIIVTCLSRTSQEFYKRRHDASGLA